LRETSTVADLPEVRVSDAEREAAAGTLRNAAVDGRLTLEEFVERLDGLYAARTAGDLEPLVADLPAASATSAIERRAPRRFVLSLLGGNRLRGRFRLSNTLTAVSIMGGCHIDLRDAEIDGGVAHVRCFALMGGISVIVPEGVEVDARAFAFLGGRNVRIEDRPPLPSAPLIRVRMFAVMGGASVRSKPPRRRRD
jgi:hypothetical protein